MKSNTTNTKVLNSSIEYPRNEAAEKNVLGSLMLNPSIVDRIVLKLKPEDFFNPVYGTIYNRIVSIVESGNVLDLVTLVHELDNNGELKEVGGEATLAELMSATQVAAHADTYADYVKDASNRRRLISGLLSSADKAGTGENEMKNIVGQTEELVSDILDAATADNTVPMSDVILDTMQTIDRRAEGKDFGIPTGFSGLDKIISGLHGSELIVLAARPGMGKTALALNIAEHVAVDRNIPTLFFSLEMNKVELCMRILSARSMVYGTRFRAATFSTGESQRVSKASNEIANAPLYINDTASITVSEITAICRRYKRRNQLGLVVIDYLGLIEPEDKRVPRQEQVSRMIRRLKVMAKNLEVPVLCLCQLNRGTEITRDTRPRLSNLRESGSIEQDADVVLFIHRENYYKSSAERGVDEINSTEDAGNTQIIVAKQRNGPIGDVDVVFESGYTKFRDPIETIPNTSFDSDVSYDFAQYSSSNF